MKVKIAPRVVRQIEEIYDYYLINDSAERATKVLNSFYAAFESCSKNPFRFPRAKSGSNHIRKGVIYRTFIFRYHIYQQHIRIISIIHGKRMA